MSRLPTYYISHGGGPWPWMDERRTMYVALEDSLVRVAREVGARPKAILVVSAHWEAPAFTATTHPRPPMVYDYYGFPPHTYAVQYPAPGAPALAQQIDTLLRDAGLPTALDAQRGLDHGTYVPLTLMYPEADVPVVQLSMQHHFDPAMHLAAGRALAPLRDEGVLILGSGQSFHNLRVQGPSALSQALAFDNWLHHTLEELPPAQRSAELQRWEQAPGARTSHPTDDHLLPLMVALGAADQEAGHTLHHEISPFRGLPVSSFRFGALS